MRWNDPEAPPLIVAVFTKDQVMEDMLGIDRYEPPLVMGGQGHEIGEIVALSTIATIALIGLAMLITGIWIACR